MIRAPTVFLFLSCAMHLHVCMHGSIGAWAAMDGGLIKMEMLLTSCPAQCSTFTIELQSLCRSIQSAVFALFFLLCQTNKPA
jgi:hypothetical protein